MHDRSEWVRDKMSGYVNVCQDAVVVQNKENVKERLVSSYYNTLFILLTEWLLQTTWS